MKTLQLVAILFALIAMVAAEVSMMDKLQSGLDLLMKRPGLGARRRLMLKELVCGYFDPSSGREYNLNALKGRVFDGKDGAQGNPNYFYKFAVCDSYADSNDCHSKDGMICQFDTSKPDDNKFEAVLSKFKEVDPGDVTWSLIDESNPNAGVQLYTKNGDLCGPEGSQAPRTTKINFSCGTPASDNSFVVQSQPESCDYTIDFPSRTACGVAPPKPAHGLSGGTVFLIIVLVTSFVYVVAGCGYNYAKTEKRGLDACPNKEFWAALPGLVGAGCAFTAAKIKGCFSSTHVTAAGEYENA